MKFQGRTGPASIEGEELTCSQVDQVTGPGGLLKIEHPLITDKTEQIGILRRAREEPSLGAEIVEEGTVRNAFLGQEHPFVLEVKDPRHEIDIVESEPIRKMPATPEVVAAVKDIFIC